MDIQTVKHIAKLSHIKATDAELERLAGELSSIIEYVSELEKADTQGTEITARASGVQNVMREDDPLIKENSEMAIDLVNAAPDKEDGYVKVKAIL